MVRAKKILRSQGLSETVAHYGTRSADATLPVANRGGFSQRLELALQGESVHSLSVKSGVGDSLLRKYLSGSEPGLEKAALIARAKNLSLDWLATGEGPMKRGETAVFGDMADEFVMVRRFDVRSAAGAGAVAETAEQLAPLAFRKDWIRTRLRRNPDTLMAIENGGDSMYPTIADGDILLIDTGESEIRTQGIYSLVIDGLLVTKRCLIGARGKLVLKSDNPSYGVTEMHPADIEDLRVLGRVVWHGGMI